MSTSSSVVSGLEPGVNYKLEVPMDSGTAAAINAYMPTALKPFWQFKLKVQIGQVTYLPIEMIGNFAQIGQPSLKTRIDLTLGVDSDGDGLGDLRGITATFEVRAGSTPGTASTNHLGGALLEYVSDPVATNPGPALERIAQERGVKLGGEVGYQIRFERVESAQTRIKFVTEALLLRQMASDPELKGVGAVVLQEARTIHFAIRPDVAIFEPKRSSLVADGRNKPQIAVRLLDRDGQPVRLLAHSLGGLVARAFLRRHGLRRNRRRG